MFLPKRITFAFFAAAFSATQADITTEHKGWKLKYAHETFSITKHGNKTPIISINGICATQFRKLSVNDAAATLLIGDEAGQSGAKTSDKKKLGKTAETTVIFDFETLALTVHLGNGIRQIHQPQTTQPHVKIAHAAQPKKSQSSTASKNKQARKC